MKYLVPAAALAALFALAAGPAQANVCRAEHLTCATTMPVDGYCECTSHGTTEGGTVVASHTTHERINAIAGGCGAHPDAPGCR